MALKACYLSQVLLQEQADDQVIFLAERDGDRRVPIVIGPSEAVAIDRAVKGSKFPRPLTHDLIVNLIERLGARCREIRITDLRNRTFYAELAVVAADGTEHRLDCRPSDAIAIMVRLPETPLLVEETVLAEAGV